MGGMEWRGVMKYRCIKSEKNTVYVETGVMDERNKGLQERRNRIKMVLVLSYSFRII